MKKFLIMMHWQFSALMPLLSLLSKSAVKRMRVMPIPNI